MKISSLYGDINPKFLPEELKKFHNDIPVTNERARKGIRATYLTTLLEARATEGLFWLVPDGETWRPLFFEAEYFKQDSHAIIWNEMAAEIVAKAYGKEADDKFKKLYAAYPRGRVIEMDGWVVGFGGDLPPGWTDERLKSALNVWNGTTRVGNHWIHDPSHRKLADEFLGR